MHFVNKLWQWISVLSQYCLPYSISFVYLFIYLHVRIYSSCLQGRKVYFMLLLEVSIGGRWRKKVHAGRDFFEIHEPPSYPYLFIFFSFLQSQSFQGVFRCCVFSSPQVYCCNRLRLIETHKI